MTLFKALKQHRDSLQQTTLVEMFVQDALRAEKLTFSAAGLSLDISKNHITEDTLSLLLQWAQQQAVGEKISDLFQGKKVNTTEQRAVTHPFVRDSQSQHPVAVESRRVLEKMFAFNQALLKGDIRGATGAQFTDVVNIGTGGSDLGPRMATNALRLFRTSNIEPHFVANIDPQDFDTVVAKLNPQTTLFIATSKTFGTQETLVNLALAKQWLLQGGVSDWQQQAVAVTANPAAASEMGFNQDRIFQFDEGVGGRYSVWSAVGLILLLTLGEKNFMAFHQGAAAMDAHFKTAPLKQNLPVLLALVYAWYRNFWQCQSHGVLPYAHGLQRFPDYLQQLEMESLGKSVDLQNHTVPSDTGGVIWGRAGTMGQHSFYQLLHQGTNMIPVDFVAVLQTLKPSELYGHKMLLANCIAQSRTLMTGKSTELIAKELAEQGLDETDIAMRAAHGAMPGNRPSSMIIMDSLTPQNLGALMALYEHKVFVLAQLWGINAFDQWGVEYGKVICNSALDALSGKARDQSWDGSSMNIVERYKQTLKQE